MTENDLEAVLEIENKAYSRPWLMEHFEREFSNNIAFMYTLKGMCGGKKVLAGYVVFWVVYAEAHILNITVASEFRRQGLALFLMEDVLAMMKQNKVDDVFLEVRKSNRAAIDLYRKLDFKDSYERKKYYGDEDAIVMRLVFNEYIDLDYNS